MHRMGVFERHRRDGTALQAVAGPPILAQGALGPCPLGYVWYVEIAAFLVVGNSHTAIMALAVTPDNGPLNLATWDGYGLAASSGAAAILGEPVTTLPIIVPEGHWLRVLLFGGTLAAGDAATLTTQTAVHSLAMDTMMGPEDRAQVLAAHERIGAELALSAVATDRAV